MSFRTLGSGVETGKELPHTYHEGQFIKEGHQIERLAPRFHRNLFPTVQINAALSVGNTCYEREISQANLAGLPVFANFPQF